MGWEGQQREERVYQPMVHRLTFSSHSHFPPVVKVIFKWKENPLKNPTCRKWAFVKSLRRKWKIDTYILKKKKTYSKRLSELGSGLLQELVPGLSSFFPFPISGITPPLKPLTSLPAAPPCTGFYIQQLYNHSYPTPALPNHSCHQRVTVLVAEITALLGRGLRWRLATWQSVSSKGTCRVAAWLDLIA